VLGKTVFNVGDIVSLASEYVGISTYLGTFNRLNGKTQYGLIVKKTNFKEFADAKNEKVDINTPDYNVYYVVTSLGVIEAFNFDLREVNYDKQENKKSKHSCSERRV
jgi:hypothetical protein